MSSEDDNDTACRQDTFAAYFCCATRPPSSLVETEIQLCARQVADAFGSQKKAEKFVEDLLKLNSSDEIEKRKIAGSKLKQIIGVCCGYVSLIAFIIMELPYILFIPLIKCCPSELSKFKAAGVALSFSSLLSAVAFSFIRRYMMDKSEVQSYELSIYAFALQMVWAFIMSRFQKVKQFDDEKDKEEKRYIYAYQRCIGILGVDLKMHQILKLQDKMFSFCFNTVVFWAGAAGVGIIANWFLDDARYEYRCSCDLFECCSVHDLRLDYQHALTYFVSNLITLYGVTRIVVFCILGAADYVEKDPCGILFHMFQYKKDDQPPNESKC